MEEVEQIKTLLTQFKGLILFLTVQSLHHKQESLSPFMFYFLFCFNTLV